MGEPVLFLVLSLAGGGGGGQENEATFVHQKSFPDQNLPADSGSKGDIGAALGELKGHRLQEWLTRLKPLTCIPRGSTSARAKVEVAFAAPGWESRLHRRPRPQKGMGRDAAPQSLRKLFHLRERLPTVQQLWAQGRRRRAVFLPRPAPSGTERLAAKGSHAQDWHQSRLALARPTFKEETDSRKPADPARRTLPNQPDGASVVPGHHRRAIKRGMRPPLPSPATEVVGAAHETGCRCPYSQRTTVVAQEMEARRGGLRVPTPRTEEAAWAASALTFLLVVLTLAVLYTRLHRKCRRGPSLYWMTGSEEGRETVAAVMKRRLFPRPRRTKRPRQLPRLLLSSSSSHEDSSSA